MATIERQVDDVLSNTGSDVKWILIGREGESQVLEVAGKGQSLAALRQQLNDVKNPCVGLFSQAGMCLSFRYGAKSKEMIASHDIKALIKQRSPSFNVTNIDSDLSDDAISKQSRLPNLPSKLAGQEPSNDFSRASSSESIASLTPEEKEEELKIIQRRTEEINLSCQRKTEEALRYKKFNETVEQQKREKEALELKEKAEMRTFGERLSQMQPQTAFEGWLSLHKASSSVWHRRWILLEKPHELVIRAEANSQSIHRFNLAGAKIADAEGETGMRNSVSVSQQGEERIFLLADNRTEYLELFAALSYLS
ncbi:hypothetical protein HDU67_001595 [Dinochytrium kinnereticum]|nr:hypothetical protein HDU67_001595 [Dinochytrium kinnereticum]